MFMRSCLSPCAFCAEPRTQLEHGRAVAAVTSDDTQVKADHFVVAVGPRVQPFMKASTGVHVPVYPIRGYSLTVPVRDSASGALVCTHSCVTRFVVGVVFSCCVNACCLARAILSQMVPWACQKRQTD